MPVLLSTLLTLLAALTPSIVPVERTEIEAQVLPGSTSDTRVLRISNHHEAPVTAYAAELIVRFEDGHEKRLGYERDAMLLGAVGTEDEGAEVPPRGVADRSIPLPSRENVEYAEPALEVRFIAAVFNNGQAVGERSAIADIYARRAATIVQLRKAIDILDRVIGGEKRVPLGPSSLRLECAVPESLDSVAHSQAEHIRSYFTKRVNNVLSDRDRDPLQTLADLRLQLSLAQELVLTGLPSSAIDGRIDSILDCELSKLDQEVQR